MSDAEVNAGADQGGEAMNDQIESAINDMIVNQETINQIVDFCTEHYPGTGISDEQRAADIFAKTRQYTSDAFQNVLYRVTQVAKLLNDYIEEQANAVDRMTTEANAVAERLCSYYDRTGSDCLCTAEVEHPYEVREMSRKLQGLCSRSSFFFIFFLQGTTSQRTRGRCPNSSAAR